jgi:hypothetical protein
MGGTAGEVQAKLSLLRSVSLKIGTFNNLETQEEQHGRYGELYLRKPRRAAWEDVGVEYCT